MGEVRGMEKGVDLARGGKVQRAKTAARQSLSCLYEKG